MVLMTASIRKAASSEGLDSYAIWLKTIRQLCTVRIPIPPTLIGTYHRAEPAQSIHVNRHIPST